MKTKLLKRFRKQRMTWEMVAKYLELSEAYYKKHKKSIDFFQKLISKRNEN